MATHNVHTAPMLTLDDVAARLQVCTKTVYRWTKQGSLRVHRIGRQLRVTEEDLATFIAINRK